MNDVRSQFIAVCPECSADLTVNFEKLGQHIACPQCHQTFVAGEASLPDNDRSVEKPARPVNQAKSQVDRIDVVCTNCNATLRVRRAYIGNDVRCKYCDQVFRVLAAAGTQARTEAEEPDPRQKALQAEHEQLYVAHNLLQADHDRLKTECTGLRDNLRCVTLEIEAIRAALGTIAPEEVGSLANERQSLTEEVRRLRDEIHSLLPAQAERDQLVEDQQRWESALDSAHAERDLLAKQLKEREDQLEAARTDHARLSVERLAALTEVEQLQVALAQSIEATQRECETRRSERLVPDEIEAQAEPTSSRNLATNGERSTTAAELEGLRAQVAELGQRLNESELLHGEMAAVLEGMGIRCRSTRV